MFGEVMNFKLKQDEARRRKLETDWSTGVFVGVDPRTSEALIVSGEGLFKCRTVRRVVREEAFGAGWLEKAITPIDEFVSKGAKSSFADVRTQRHIVPGGAPVPEDVGRTYIPRRTRLKPDDFDKFDYTEDCRGCEFLQTGIGGRQNHSDACRARIETELDKSEEGRERLGKSKDRIDHWVEKSENMNIDKDDDILIKIPSVPSTLTAIRQWGIGPGKK